MLAHNSQTAIAFCVLSAEMWKLRHRRNGNALVPGARTCQTLAYRLGCAAPLLLMSVMVCLVCSVFGYVHIRVRWPTQRAMTIPVVCPLRTDAQQPRQHRSRLCCAGPAHAMTEPPHCGGSTLLHSCRL